MGADRVRACCLAVVAAIASLGAWAPTAAARVGNVRVVGEFAWHGVQAWRIAYHAHNGANRHAYVLLPSWYKRTGGVALPFVISPHGRGVSALAGCRLWGNLPTVGGFGVVCPEGQGRRLRSYSWGAPGQIDDLAHMVQYTREALPWIRVRAHRLYVVGGSMGGQEALLVAARFPRRFAGVIAFDAVANFARQYVDWPRLRCDSRCRHDWNGPIGRGLQQLARSEVGGSPAEVPRWYEARSPLHYARRLAFAHIPIELWWSTSDLVVGDQSDAQSGALFTRIMQLNPSAPVEGFVGAWRHSAEERARSRLPFALAQLDLMPARSLRRADGLRERHFVPRRTFAFAADGRVLPPVRLAHHRRLRGGTAELSHAGACRPPASC